MSWSLNQMNYMQRMIGGSLIPCSVMIPEESLVSVVMLGFESIVRGSTLTKLTGIDKNRATFMCAQDLMEDPEIVNSTIASCEIDPHVDGPIEMMRVVYNKDLLEEGERETLDFGAYEMGLYYSVACNLMAYQNDGEGYVELMNEHPLNLDFFLHGRLIGFFRKGREIEVKLAKVRLEEDDAD